MSNPAPSTSTTTREQWLTLVAQKTLPLFEEKGFTVPENIRYSVGWPSKGALGKKKRRIGECWNDKCSEGEVFEIFISPYLKDVVQVVATLIHEMVHATVGLEAGHGKVFGQCARAVGLTGKMTATTETPELAEKIKDIVRDVGPYPHSKLDGGGKTSGPAKQTTRLLKCECEGCGMIIRTTAKWIDETGLPTCSCGSKFVSPDGDDTEDGGDDD